MKQFFGNKYVKGLTHFIQAEHFGPMDFIDYHCQRMGISRDEFMAYYGVKESVEINEKQSTNKGPIDSDEIEKALKKKAKETGVPIGIIRAVMRRGMAAWKTGHRPGASQQQWGYARCNSFLTGGEGTWGRPINDPKSGADSDLAQEAIKAGFKPKK